MLCVIGLAISFNGSILVRCGLSISFALASRNIFTPSSVFDSYQGSSVTSVSSERTCNVGSCKTTEIRFARILSQLTRSDLILISRSTASYSFMLSDNYYNLCGLLCLGSLSPSGCVPIVTTQHWLKQQAKCYSPNNQKG